MVKETLEKVFNNDTFKAALPFVFIVVGGVTLAVAVFDVVEDSKWHEFLLELGKTILTGGVFALLLKSFQFLGVFKDELADIIYGARHLKDRKDIHEIWERTSKVVFKDKFPRINAEIIKDVKNIYFPVQYVSYYDNYRQQLHIELTDAENEIVTVTQLSKYTIYPTRPKEKMELVLNNYLHYGISESEVSFELKSFLVNDTSILNTPDCHITSSTANNMLKTAVSVELRNQESYKIDTEIIKKYSLKHDNNITLTKDGIIHDLNVKIETAGVKITFKSAGTLKPFKRIGWKTSNCCEFDYEGIIYSKQGYTIFLQKN